MVKIVLFRGPLDGQVKVVNENHRSDTLTFSYTPKRKRGQRGVYWNNVGLTDSNNPFGSVDPDDLSTITFTNRTCMYRMVQYYDPQTGARFPAMRPDGAVFYEWTDARKDNNSRGPFNRYQRY